MANTNETARRTRPLKLRLPPDAYARLEALAARDGLCLSDWIAATIMAERKPRMDRKSVREGLAEARRLRAGVR